MKKLILFLIASVVFFSCGEFLNESAPNQEEGNTLDPMEYEQKLSELSLFFGEVFKDPDARKEIFDFAKIPGNDDDIEYSLKRLFSEKTNPMTRQHSAIVNQFYSYKNTEARVAGDFNVDELIEFIEQYDISILAPYMADNFDPDEITALTVSWWTEEMEIEQEEDPSGDGYTPGVYIDLMSDDNSRKNILPNSRQIIMVDDNYAIENPVIVLGQFGDDAYLYPVADGGGSYSGGEGYSNNTPPTPQFPHQLNVNCTNVLQTDIVRWEMANFRITGNTRAWPHPNRFIMWVGTAANTNSAPLLNKKKLKRSEVGKWHQNFIPNGGVLITSWEQSNFNAAIVMGYKKPLKSISETTLLTSVNSQGQVTNQVTAKFQQYYYRLIFNQTWLRCGELNGNYLVPVGNNGVYRYHNTNVAIWSYDLRRKGYEVQFTLAPKIIRFP